MDHNNDVKGIYAVKETPFTYLLDCDKKKFEMRWNNVCNELTLLDKMKS
jgi:hypothetical protein